MQPVMTKVELLRVMKKFIDDERRGISLALFCDLCGISMDTLKDVFMFQSLSLSEYVQRRVSKGYGCWLRGEIAIMQNRDKTRFIQYRKTPKMKIAPALGLQFVNGAMTIKVGMRNKADYSGFSLDEQLRGK